MNLFKLNKFVTTTLKTIISTKEINNIKPEAGIYEIDCKYVQRSTWVKHQRDVNKRLYEHDWNFYKTLYSILYSNESNNNFDLIHF